MLSPGMAEAEMGAFAPAVRLSAAFSLFAQAAAVTSTRVVASVPRVTLNSSVATGRMVISGRGSRMPEPDIRQNVFDGA